MSSPYVIDYEGVHRFPIPPDVLWSELQHFDRYQDWWRWLREFEVAGGGLRAGTVLHGVVRPPLPYRMRLTVRLVEVDEARRIEASVHGDLEGRASLTMQPEASGTRIEIAWSIEMMQRPMRAAARVAHHVLRWGHDRVVDMTVDGFRRRLVDGR